MASYALVIAKYNEDMGWLSKMNVENLYVYDKNPETGADALNIPGLRVEQLMNIGRESDSYLRYIIANYHNLPDYLLLVQGKPFDHMVGVDANNFQQKIDELVASQPHEIKPLFAKWYIENHNSYPSIKTREYYEYLFERPAPPESVFGVGCQYIVPRDCILSKSLEFYEKLHTMLHKGECSFHHAHYEHYPFSPLSINAWTFERLGAYIFGRPLP